MKWEIKKIEEGKWGIFLMKKYCKTKDPVCYGVALTEKSAQIAVERLNNPMVTKSK